MSTYIILPQTLTLYRKEALLLPRSGLANIVANIYILNGSTTSKLSAHKPRWKNKAIRFSDDEIKEVNEAFRIMKSEHPDLKTDRDLILNWIRGDTLSKPPNKRIITRTRTVIKEALRCTDLCFKDNQFQCIKRIRSGLKYIPLTSDYKKVLEHCSHCGGYWKTYTDLSKYVSWIGNVKEDD